MARGGNAFAGANPVTGKAVTQKQARANSRNRSRRVSNGGSGG